MASSASAGPVAIITGSSSGIGQATAVLFAEKGYRLSLSGRNEEALQDTIAKCIAKGLPRDLMCTTVGDLTESGVADALVEGTLSAFQRIDTLVNAAGILISGSVSSSPLEDYDKLMNVNVRCIVQLTRSAIPHLITAKGTIVNVSSINGPCSFPGVTYYCMSKAALDQFTKCLALELAPSGVRVNSVNPGVIVTNVHKRAGMDKNAYEQFLERGKQTHALGRVGDADEVAKGIFFLASSESSFTTGQLLRIDGGRGIMSPR